VASTRNRVVLYHARDCSLCERAREHLEGLGIAYDAIDITGDAELERRYREWLPVVEIDGERAFVYYVDEPALRRKLANRPPQPGSAREPG
jgi:glutaredoxin